ncbi:hypothetical protein F5B19DRAFT_354215 [Rostrohypoxylon terebratum]|nr:hypothetical protein F5B19DRAFT_354215 [Rostrohypoxylon terebratum]
MDHGVEEAIRLMTQLSQQDIQRAFFTASTSLNPAVSADDITALAAAWRSSENWMNLILKRQNDLDTPPPAVPKEVSKMLFMQLLAVGCHPGGDCAVAKQVWSTNPKKFVEEMEKLAAAVEKIGVAKDANISAENAFKTALTRYAIKQATIRGVWQNALLTGIFDIKELLDGHFKQYLFKMGASGLYGGTVGGLSTWINHPFFGNGAVLGVIVGLAFGTASLASTGDWARFGKDLGASTIGHGAAWGGGVIGGAIVGSFGSPIGTVIGGIAGGIAGGFVGRKVASSVPGVGGDTEIEVQKMYSGIKDHLSKSGIELDQSLSPEEVVWMFKTNNDGKGVSLPVRATSAYIADLNEARDVLVDIKRDSPERFAAFLRGLRAAVQK